MRYIIAITLFLFCCVAASAETPTIDDNERTWTAFIAKQINGEYEDVTLPDGSFADIITDTTVWEVEWCSKWKESIGQAIHYSNVTDLKPGIWILHRGREDYQNFNRIKGVVNRLRSEGFEIEFRVTMVRGG